MYMRNISTSNWNKW